MLTLSTQSVLKPQGEHTSCCPGDVAATLSARLQELTIQKEQNKETAEVCAAESRTAFSCFSHRAQTLHSFLVVVFCAETGLSRCAARDAGRARATFCSRTWSERR